MSGVVRDSIDVTASETTRYTRLRQIIENILEDTDSGPSNADRRAWILWVFLYIIWYEGAAATTRRQGGGGPARGLMQFEPQTVQDLVDQYIFGPTPGLIANLAAAAGVSTSEMRTALQAFRNHADPASNRWPSSPTDPAAQVEQWLLDIDSFGAKLMRYYFRRFAGHRFPPASASDLASSPQDERFKAEHSEHWAEWWKRVFHGSATETGEEERTRKRQDFEQRARQLDAIARLVHGGATIQLELHASVGSGGVNNPDDVQALKERLIELGYNWLRVDSVVDQTTIDTIRLFQSIMRGRSTVGGTGVDGRVDVPGLTLSWLQASNAPRWQEMPAGSGAEGFFNVELADPNDEHDFGTDWMAETIRSAGALYKQDYIDTAGGPAALLTVNDVSLPRGGNTPDHAGHETGLGCDLRLPRTDGTAPGATTWQTAGYDRAAMRAMLTALRDAEVAGETLVTQVFFNDPVLIGEGLCTNEPGHDNHVHFDIQPPTRA